MGPVEHLEPEALSFEVLHYLTPEQVAETDVYVALIERTIAATPPSEAYCLEEFTDAVEGGQIICFGLRQDGELLGLLAIEPREDVTGARFIHVVAFAGRDALKVVPAFHRDCSKIARSMGCGYFTWQTSDERIARALVRLTSAVKIAETYLVGVKP